MDGIASAPILDIEILSIEKKAFLEKGKIDTGADMTLIPKKLVESLDLKETGEVELKGVNSSRICKTYDVFVKIGEIEFDLLQVVATERNNVLIGRDLINLWQMNLDGENEIGEINPWSTDPSTLIL